jgi:porphobilinogen synthase
MQDKTHLVDEITGHRRMRRNRKAEWTRRLVQENRVTVDDLIWPVFVVPGSGIVEPIAAMPGVNRMSVDMLVEATKEAADLGIPAIATFPNIEMTLRDETGSNSLEANNLINQATAAIKKAVPGIGVITDVALDPFTSHGHDGISAERKDRQRRNCRPGLSSSRHPGRRRFRYHCSLRNDGRSDRRNPPGAGCRWPSGRRHHELCHEVRLGLLWTVPGSDLHRRPAEGRQEDLLYRSGQRHRSDRDAALDVEEGADMLMVKPGLPYIDICWRMKEAFGLPTFAYQVSGEYSQIKAAAMNGWIDGERAMLETLLAFKRAGCDGVLTYFAVEVARLLAKR